MPTGDHGAQAVAKSGDATNNCSALRRVWLDTAWQSENLESAICEVWMTPEIAH